MPSALPKFKTTVSIVKEQKYSFFYVPSARAILLYGEQIQKSNKHVLLLALQVASGSRKFCKCLKCAIKTEHFNTLQCPFPSEMCTKIS